MLSLQLSIMNTYLLSKIVLEPEEIKYAILLLEAFRTVIHGKDIGEDLSQKTTDRDVKILVKLLDKTDPGIFMENENDRYLIIGDVSGHADIHAVSEIMRRVLIRYRSFRSVKLGYSYRRAENLEHHHGSACGGGIAIITQNGIEHSNTDVIENMFPYREKVNLVIWKDRKGEVDVVMTDRPDRLGMVMSLHEEQEGAFMFNGYKGRLVVNDILLIAKERFDSVRTYISEFMKTYR